MAKIVLLVSFLLLLCSCVVVSSTPSPSLKPTSAKPVAISDPKKSPSRVTPSLKPSTASKLPTLPPINVVNIEKTLPKYASIINGRLTYKFNVIQF